MSAPCKTCGFDIPADDWGLCARCLLQMARATTRKTLPRVFGKYQLRQELGRGGVGVVFCAHDPDADRLVALKLLREGELADPDDVGRFQDEARRVAGLRHEGIVRVLDVGAHEGQPFFTMELLEGGALADRIAEFRGHPRAAARLVADAARAVHHAHQRFILHRDLKPANLLLDGARRPHVADFGIAQRLDVERLSGPGVIMGTLPYMAPEQITTPGDLTVTVDVYGLGAILYELLCGRPPIDGATAAELVKNVVDRHPAAPRAVVTDGSIDLDLQTICLKCLRKAPGDRYASAAGVAADLDRYLADEPIAARRPRTRERFARTLRRHPAGSALAAAAVLLLATTTVAAVSVARAQERELRAEALKVNAYAARALSGAVLFELRALADDLEKAAHDPAALAVLERPQAERVAAWRARPLPARLDSLLLLDDRCQWIARSPRPERDFPGASFDWRDYCAGTARLGSAGARGVHVSRAYASTADGSVRFSLGTPIYDGDGRWRGMLQGALVSATALGGLALIDPGERGRIATLVARRDRARRDEPLPNDWLVLLHDGVAHGSKHRMENGEALGALPTPSEQPLAATARAAVYEDDHRDPVPGFEGRWLAGIAPVGGTPFAVIVQTRYQAAVAPNQRLARHLGAAGGGALGFAALVCGALLLFDRARRARRADR